MMDQVREVLLIILLATFIVFMIVVIQEMLV